MVRVLDCPAAYLPVSGPIVRAGKNSLHWWWTTNLDLFWIDELIKYASILREEAIKAAAEADNMAEDATLADSDWIEWLKCRSRVNKKDDLAREFCKWYCTMSVVVYGYFTDSGGLLTIARSVPGQYELRTPTARENDVVDQNP